LAKFLTPLEQPLAVCGASLLSNWGVLSSEPAKLKSPPMNGGLFSLVRPERFELPTNWFEDLSRKIEIVTNQ
jgi:hypothetical protein